MPRRHDGVPLTSPRSDMESTRSHHGRPFPDTPSPDRPLGGPPGGDLAARYRAILAGDDPAMRSNGRECLRWSA